MVRFSIGELGVKRVPITQVSSDEVVAPLRAYAEVLKASAGGASMSRTEVFQLAPTLTGIVNLLVKAAVEWHNVVTSSYPKSSGSFQLPFQAQQTRNIHAIVREQSLGTAFNSHR